MLVSLPMAPVTSEHGTEASLAVFHCPKVVVTLFVFRPAAWCYVEGAHGFGMLAS